MALAALHGVIAFFPVLSSVPKGLPRSHWCKMGKKSGLSNYYENCTFDVLGVLGLFAFGIIYHFIIYVITIWVILVFIPSLSLG